MDRHSLGALAHFCTYQQDELDAPTWLSQGAADPKAYGVAAKYLSMTSWYGHEQELERIAAQLCPALLARGAFERESQSIGFDLAYFSSSLRYRIGLRGARKAAETAVLHTADPVRPAVNAAEDIRT